ncbi:MAG: alpha-L-fucosidase [Saprospiraceae bacterium]|nr:alpha-L-fucosidase [Saprospiraceae bacterium]
MSNWILLLAILTGILFSSCHSNSVAPPEPVQPIPTARQLAWQDLEFYAFVHFNMNTFTDMEWGTGGEDPALFNPTQLDCHQWARVFKEAGMKGIIITAKHHDGFCLWPSKYTEHSVKNSPWRNGDGDVIRELQEACAEYGLKLGIYYSPWDRNHADYGKPQYLEYMRRQLKELLTQYGDIFEVWFDGANGGTGYYGGANEERRVDKLTYYDWETTYKLIREWQPNAVIFSDAGPDVRWVGNESGHSYPTIWSNLMRDSVYGGMPTYHTDWADGQENGTHWVPAETNVSIRPGWYYHAYEDHKVKSVPKLVDIYYESVGMNTPLLLNFPVDTRGLVHETDALQVQNMMKKIRADFANNLVSGASASASNTRGSSFGAGNVIDQDKHSYWATDDSTLTASLTIAFDTTVRFNRFLIQEYIPLGQRIKAFTLEYLEDGTWKEIARETTIGYKRILRFPTVESNQLRINFTDSKACPVICNVGVYDATPLLYPPQFRRSIAGDISIQVPDSTVEIFYTLDGSAPDINSIRYTSPFNYHDPVSLQAIAMDASGHQSEIGHIDFDIAPTDWRIINRDTSARNAIDGDENTYWTAGSGDYDQVIIDLGKPVSLTGFSYLPPQNRWFSGIISEYALYVSNGGGGYRLAQKGEFSNIKNSPVWQKVEIPEQKCRYIKLKALKTIDGNPPSFAEVGVFTKH